MAIKLLEGDKEVESILKDKADYNDLITLRNREVLRISKTLEDVETAVSNEKYGFMLKETKARHPEDLILRPAMAFIAGDRLHGARPLRFDAMFINFPLLGFHKHLL